MDMTTVLQVGFIGFGFLLLFRLVEHTWLLIHDHHPRPNQISYRGTRSGLPHNGNPDLIFLEARRDVRTGTRTSQRRGSE